MILKKHITDFLNLILNKIISLLFKTLIIKKEIINVIIIKNISMLIFTIKCIFDANKILLFINKIPTNNKIKYNTFLKEKFTNFII
jgi:hypothetical protein